MSNKMAESEIKERLLHWAATWLDYPSGPFYVENLYYPDLPDEEFERTCVLCGEWIKNGGYASIKHRSDCLHLAAVNHFGGYMSGVYGVGALQEYSYEVGKDEIGDERWDKY